MVSRLLSCFFFFLSLSIHPCFTFLHSHLIFISLFALAHSTFRNKLTRFQTLRGTSQLLHLASRDEIIPNGMLPLSHSLGQSCHLNVFRPNEQSNRIRDPVFDGWWSIGLYPTHVYKGQQHEKRRKKQIHLSHSSGGKSWKECGSQKNQQVNK